MKDSIVEIECLIFLLLLGFVVVFVFGVVTAQRVRVTIKVVVEGKENNRRCCYNINKGYIWEAIRAVTAQTWGKGGNLRCGVTLAGNKGGNPRFESTNMGN